MEGLSSSVLCSLAADDWMVFLLCSLSSRWCRLPVSWLFLRAVLLLGIKSLFLRQLCVCAIVTLINSLGFLHPDVTRTFPLHALQVLIRGLVGEGQT